MGEDKSDSAPGWTPGLVRCGAGPRRLCVARWPRAPLPPPAGPPSAGVRAERAGRSAAACSSWPLPLLRIGLQPPLPCRLRPASRTARRFRLRPAIAGLRRDTGGPVVRRLPAAPNPNQIPGARVFSSSSSVCLHAAKPVAPRKCGSLRLRHGGAHSAKQRGTISKRMRLGALVRFRPYSLVSRR